jgi:OmpA-OmpF porin, OOP family
VVLDTATTLEDRYQNRRHGQRAREIVSRLNRTVPALDTRASLAAFSAGSCLSCDDADVLYGPAPYNRADFEAALGRYDAAGEPGVPAGPGIDRHASDLILRDSPGRVALIVVADSENIMHGRAFKTVQKLRGKLGSRLCIYPILVDRSADGRVVTDYLVKVGGCGFTVNADEIEAPDAMARYVREIFLGPAGDGPAASPATAAADSDGDGVPDSLDRCPNTPRGAMVNPDGCWVPPGVYFDTDQAVIKDTRALDQAAAVFKANPQLTAEVQGHTDSTASAAYNRTLSEARARAVRDYFARQGIAPERIRATGFGETRPAALNDTPEGRALNRRVELQPHMR